MKIYFDEKKPFPIVLNSSPMILNLHHSFAADLLFNRAGLGNSIDLIRKFKQHMQHLVAKKVYFNKRT